MLQFILQKILGSPSERIIKSMMAKVDAINRIEQQFVELSDEGLKAKTVEFKDRLSKGASLDSLLSEAFATVREAAKRTVSMRHFDVQLIGGMVLHDGMIAEMRTGEGKTLVATLPCYLNALTGKGVHVVIPNDYLAKRDSDFTRKIHEFLGLTVGCVVGDITDEERKEAYSCDITYATNNELGFDYLRDNMKFSSDQMAQKSRNFAIIDEVDSILVDEARTPLIISGPAQDNAEIYRTIDNLIPLLSKADFEIEEKERNVLLTETGNESIEKILKQKNLIEENSSLYDPVNIHIIHNINQALKAHHLFKRDVDYIVKDNSVVIIDEFTGRMQEGRRFSDGLHQSLEAKEKLNIKSENQTLASITFQNYFRMYGKLSGMTGTALTEAIELEEIYNLLVVTIPTNKTIARMDCDDEIYRTSNEKYQAIIGAIEEAHKKQQPVLVGTVSIEKSEHLSLLLKEKQIPHKVLNAKYHEQEAHIISQAGAKGAVTIATNMAGRGTDIMLGGNAEILIKDETDPEKIAIIKQNVEESKNIVMGAGGLFVLGTERHESRRIDNQLRGRCGRQGDPGKSKFFLSLDDDLMRIFGSNKLQSMLSSLGLKEGEAIFHPWITKALAGAQKKVEARNYEIRKNLIKYDDIINNQRKVIFKLRNEVMEAKDLLSKASLYQKEINKQLIAHAAPQTRSYSEGWNFEFLEKEILRIYGIKIDFVADKENEMVDVEELTLRIEQEVQNIFSQKITKHGEELVTHILRQIFLITIDSEWRDHLLSIDKLRNSINLRAYAQQDPLVAYREDCDRLFETMTLRIEDQIVSRLAHVQINHTNHIDQ